MDATSAVEIRPNNLLVDGFVIILVPLKGIVTLMVKIVR